MDRSYAVCANGECGVRLAEQRVSLCFVACMMCLRWHFQMDDVEVHLRSRSFKVPDGFRHYMIASAMATIAARVAVVDHASRTFRTTTYVEYVLGDLAAAVMPTLLQIQACEGFLGVPGAVTTVFVHTQLSQLSYFSLVFIHSGACNCKPSGPVWNRETTCLQVCLVVVTYHCCGCH